MPRINSMSFLRRSKLLRPGSPAPDFRLARLDGAGELSLASIAESGPALLAFFKTSCPVCQFTFPFLDRIHSPGRLAVYGISQNDAASTADFNRRFGIGFPVLLDPEDDDFPASNAFGISTVPTLFLVERDRTVSRVIEGWSRRDVEALANEAGATAFSQGENVPEWKAG
jgi:peroxiredoxin